MAPERSTEYPLSLTGYFHYNSDLTFWIQRDDDMVLKRRLDDKTDCLTRDYTWKKLQNELEELAISRIKVRELMSKLHDLAKELSAIKTESVDKFRVLVVRLFLRESYTSTLLKAVLKHVLGYDASSLICHRIHKIVEELKHSISPYTLQRINKDCTFKRDEAFGGDTHFVSLDRNKIVKSDVSHLYDIELPEKDDDEEVEGTDDLSDDDGASSSLIGDQEPCDKMLYYRLDEMDHELVRYKLIPNCVSTSDSRIPVSQLSEMGQRVFGHELTLTDLESTVYKSVFDSNGNILINLPLGYDKTTLIALAALNVVERNCDSKVLYLVPSIEFAECMALRLKRCIKSTKIRVGVFTNSDELNYENVDPLHVIITTANIWEIKNMDRDSCPLQMLIVDEMNCLGEKNGPFLEVIIGRMHKQGTSLHKRIIGFTMSLLSVHCGPSFSNLAEYLNVERINQLILSEHYTPMPPSVSIIRKKEPDCQIMIDTIYENAMLNNKVVVFVKNKDDVIEVAKAIQNRMETCQSKDLALPDSVINTLMSLMKTEGTDNVSMSLCSQGYLTLHSGLSRYIRNYLCATFKTGLARIVVTTVNYAEMLSGDVDTVIVKDTDFHNTDRDDHDDDDSFVHAISSVGRMLSVATTSKNYNRHIFFFVNSVDKFQEYLFILQNDIYVRSQLLHTVLDVLNNEIKADSVKNSDDCEEWFRRSFLFSNMEKESVALGTLTTLNAEVKSLIFEVLETLEECGMIKFLGKFVIKATDFNYAYRWHQVPCTTLQFLWKNAVTFRDMNTLKNTLCNAPLFSSLMERMDHAQDDEISALAQKFYIKKCENWRIKTLLKAALSGKGSPKLKCLKTFLIKEMIALIGIMFEIYLTAWHNGAMTTMLVQLACTMEKCLKEPNNIPELDFEAEPQMISKFVMNVNFHIHPGPSWKTEVGDSGDMFWLWILDTSNHVQNYTSVELTRQCIEEDTDLMISLPVHVTELVQSPCKAYLLSCKSWQWFYCCVIPFHKMILPTDNPTYTELMSHRLLSKTALKNDILEDTFNFRLFDPVITQAFDSLYHHDKNVLVTSSPQDLITAAEIAISRAVTQKPGTKVVYVTKWMHEVEKRFISWKNKFEKLGQKVINFSGQVEKDIEHFFENDIILATSRHWEIASRSREIRECLNSENVSLIIMNGLHQLDGEMESALMRILASPQQDLVRVLGLSYASIASSEDIMKFIQISPESDEVFNFQFPNRVEVLGFFQRDFHKKSRAMMLSVWNMLQNVQSKQTVVILVPTRDDIYMTAEGLKKFEENDINSHLFTHPRNDEEKIETLDANVSEFLKLGIGILDSGMHEHDRNIVLARLRGLRIIILNMDVAEPPQMENHLLIVKGTEVLDDKLGTYVDIPVREIANRMYSCGDNWKRAVILSSYSKSFMFRYHFKDGLLLESLLPNVICEVINSEIVAGVINTLESTVKYLQHSFLALRLTSNPCFYHMGENPEMYLRTLARRSLRTLVAMGCITIENSDVQVYEPTVLGLLSSIYGLNCVTMKLLKTHLYPDISMEQLLLLVCNAIEFKNLPFCKEDEQLKERLRNQCRWPVDLPDFPPLVEKVFILIQYHFSKAEKIHPKFVAYESDVKEVVETAVKIAQVLVCISCHEGWLRSALNAQRLVQMLVTGCWGTGKDALLSLPHVTFRNWDYLVGNSVKSVNTLRQLQHLYRGPFDYSFCALSTHFVQDQISEIATAVRSLPKLNVGIKVYSEEVCWEIKPINRRACNTYLKLHAGVEYRLAVELDEEENGNYCTLIFGSETKNEVFTMERVEYTHVKILMFFKTPESAGRVTYKIFLLPDDHIGIDQVYDLKLNIVHE